MSNTIRKDKNGKKHKESLLKHNARYKCRCERCTGIDTIDLQDKIAEKELKQQIKTDEYNFKQNGEFIEDIDDPYYTSRNRNI